MVAMQVDMDSKDQQDSQLLTLLLQGCKSVFAGLPQSAFLLARVLAVMLSTQGADRCPAWKSCHESSARSSSRYCYHTRRDDNVRSHR